MSQPQHVTDGDFTVAAQNGPWKYAYPFSDKGDAISFTASRKMRCDQDSFVAPTLRTTRSFAGKYSVAYPKVEVSAGAVLTSGSYTQTTPAIGYLCSFTDPTPVDDTSGILEWEEKYANVPATRREFGSTNYTQIIGMGATDNELQFSGSFDAYNYFEYALIPPDGDVYLAIQAPPSGFVYFPPVPALLQLRAPRVMALGPGVIQVIGGSAENVYAQGVPILASDSTSELYEGIFLCRMSIWVVKATLATL